MIFHWNNRLLLMCARLLQSNQFNLLKPAPFVQSTRTRIHICHHSINNRWMRPSLWPTFFSIVCFSWVYITIRKKRMCCYFHYILILIALKCLLWKWFYLNYRPSCVNMEVKSNNSTFVGTIVISSQNFQTHNCWYEGGKEAKWQIKRQTYQSDSFWWWRKGIYSRQRHYRGTWCSPQKVKNFPEMFFLNTIHFPLNLYICFKGRVPSLVRGWTSLLQAWSKTHCLIWVRKSSLLWYKHFSTNTFEHVHVKLSVFTYPVLFPALNFRPYSLGHWSS